MDTCEKCELQQPLGDDIPICLECINRLFEEFEDLSRLENTKKPIREVQTQQ